MTIRGKPHILDLDPFSLIEVFEYLCIDDLCELRKTCAMFKEIAEKVFILKYANEVQLLTTNRPGLYYVPVVNKVVLANRMLKSFHHLIKSITFRHEIGYKVHPLEAEYIVKLITDKSIDFKDLFFRRQLRALPEKSHLKEYNFVRNGVTRYRNFVEQEDFKKTATEIHFFELTDRVLAQRLQAKIYTNVVSICVNVSLPPETVSQLCLYAPKIEYLALYHMGDTNFDINGLSGLKHLKILNLSLCNATAEHLKCLHDLNVTIECLLIRDAVVDDTFVAYIKKLKQIRALVFTDNNNSFDENRLVQIVLVLPKLVTVVIDKKISVDGLKNVQNGCPSLLELEVEGLHSPLKLASVKKLLTTLKRVYIASSNSCEHNSAPESVNSHNYLVQSISPYSYMFENMAKTY